MGKAWIGVAVLVAAGVGAYVAVKMSGPDLGPVGPNRDLAPDSLAVYVELPDLKSTWSKMRTTEAWNDFAGSKLAKHLLDVSTVKDVLAAIDEVSKKAAYPVDADNAMKFLGHECSVGLALDAKGGAPNVLVLTKLDVDSLSKDLIHGKTDLRALWDEMQKRTGQCDCVVTPEEYKGHTLANAVRGKTKFSAALIGDTLAVASDAALVRAAIDNRASNGEHSIGKKASFQADVKALPAGATAFDWLDLDAIGANRASFDAGLAAVGADPGAAAAAHAILEGTAGAHSVAQAYVVPEGDLYRTTRKLSKSAELFADKAAPDLRGLFEGNWLAYVEFHDLGAAADAWKKSAARRKLAESRFGQWLDAWMNDPVKQADDLTSWGRRTLPFLAGRAEEDSTEEGKNVAAARDVLDKFAMHMGKHLVEEQLGAILKGDAAFAIEPKDDFGDVPRVAWAIRLDTEGRLAMLALDGALTADAKNDVSSEKVGARTIYSGGKDKKEVHWALVGDAAFISTDLALVKKVAGDGKPAGLGKRVVDAIAALKPGWRGFAYLDMQGMMALARRVGGRGGPEPSPVKDLQDFAASASGQDVSFAGYVADDFSSVEIRTRTELGDQKDTEFARLLRAGGSREPMCWSSHPDTTIASVAYPANGVDLIWFLVKKIVPIIPGGDLAAMEDGFKSAFEMDLEKEFIPALGHEFSFSIAFKGAAQPKAAAPGRPSMPVIPGFTLGIELKDAAAVRKVIDKLLDMAQQGAERPGRPAHKMFAHEQRDGAEVVCLDPMSDEAKSMPVQPALAYLDGYVLIGSDADTIRASVDAAHGKGKRMADTPAFADAANALGRKCVTFAYLEWPRMLDQISVYAPEMAGMFASDVKYPDYPENGDNAEWRRRVAEYEKKMTEAKASGSDKVKAWIDSFRVVEYMGSMSTVSESSVDGTMLVKFVK